MFKENRRGLVKYLKGRRRSITNQQNVRHESESLCISMDDLHDRKIEKLIT
jgi:hypothetical protein